MNLQGYVFRDGVRPLLPQVRLQPCASSLASPLPPGLRGQGREPRVPPGRAPRRCLSFALRPRGRLRGVSRACLPVRQPPRPRPACSIVELFAGEPSTWLCFLLPSSWRRRFMSARPSARTCSHLLAPARTCSRLPAGAFPGAPLRLRRRLDAPGISGWACLFLTRAEVSLVRGVAGGLPPTPDTWVPRGTLDPTCSGGEVGAAPRWGVWCWPTRSLADATGPRRGTVSAPFPGRWGRAPGRLAGARHCLESLSCRVARLCAGVISGCDRVSPQLCTMPGAPGSRLDF